MKGDKPQPLQLNNWNKNILGLLSDNHYRKSWVWDGVVLKYWVENMTLIWHQATSIVAARQKSQRVQLFLKPFISKSLIRKAVSQVVSAGNELVSSEVLDFVGFVVFCYYSIQHLGLSSPPNDFSSLRLAACFAPGTHFSFSHRTQAIELPLIQNK